jgi:protein-S-isoprenylcysteine O-methyltransferase Ste14
MAKLSSEGRPPTLRRWLASTPRRTFVLYPIFIAISELALHRAITIHWAATPLLAWGYLQYRLSGEYRTRHGGGGPGIDNPPVRLVTTGIYRFTRNPMYSGHLIFMLGLAILFASWLGAALLVFHLWWFNRRVLDDEAHVKALFGAEYDAYARRVRRWGLI